MESPATGSAVGGAGAQKRGGSGRQHRIAPPSSPTTQRGDYRPIDELLPRLDRVRQTAPDRWLASCPTSAHEHGDRHPSLGIRELGDGTVLMRCYSHGCTADDVVRALDLRVSDLFADRRSDRVCASESPRLPYRDLLTILRVEAMVAAVAASDAAPHLKSGDGERAMLAATRIRNALEIAGVRS